MTPRMHELGIRPVHASDVRNHARCQRLAVLGRRTLRQPYSRGSAGRIGTAVHAGVQRYVQTGTLPDTDSTHDRIAVELAPHVPAGTLGVEVAFAVDWKGYTLGGSIDLVAPGIVIDWKTLSDWAQRLTTLAGEPQPAWYSYAYTASGGGAPPELRWVYVHTSTYQVRPLIGRVARDAVDAFGPVIEWLVDQDVRGVDPMSIPGNRAECSRFGGCTFRKLCGPEELADRLDRVSL